MAFLFRKIMNLGRHGLVDYLATLVSSCAGFTEPRFRSRQFGRFRLQACHHALAFLLPPRERNANKETSLKLVGATRAARVPSVPKTGVQKLLYHAPIEKSPTQRGIRLGPARTSVGLPNPQGRLRGTSHGYSTHEHSFLSHLSFILHLPKHSSFQTKPQCV